MINFTTAERWNNRTTGPTLLPECVRQKISEPIISHRSELFQSEFAQVRDKLQFLLNSSIKPFALTCSGTGGLEASLLNTIQDNTKVLALTAGYYGDLYALLAERHVGKNSVTRLRFPPGSAMDPDKIKQELKKGRYDIVLITHNESSTGVLHPLREITQIIKENSDALILVDAISSIGATAFHFDQWDIDIAVTVPQKALMSPPGLALVAISDRVLKIIKNNEIPHYYFSFIHTYYKAEDNSTISTPCVTTVRALHSALNLLWQKGLPEVYARHKQWAKRFREKIGKLSYQLFADETYASPSITAIALPEKISAKKLQYALATKFNISCSVGLDTWQDSVLRIGHMGHVEYKELMSVITVLQNLGRNL